MALGSPFSPISAWPCESYSCSVEFHVTRNSRSSLCCMLPGVVIAEELDVSLTRPLLKASILLHSWNSPPCSLAIRETLSHLHLFISESNLSLSVSGGPTAVSGRSWVSSLLRRRAVRKHSTSCHTWLAK